MTLRARCLLICLAAIALAATDASAQSTFSLSGRAATGAGVFVRLPAVGTSCGSITGSFGQPTMIPQKSPAPFTMTATALNPEGCITGISQTLMTNGTGGFQLPQDFFSAPVTGMLRVAAVPNTPMVVQLATSFNFAGPYMLNSAFGPINAVKYDMATAPYAAWNQFRAGAWMTQTGRVGANFTACATMNAANVSCTYPSQGMIPAIVKNTAGANAFGGTMGLVITSGTSHVSSLGITIGGGRILMNVLQGMSSRAAGRGYAATNTDDLIGGTIWNMYKLTDMTTSMNAVIGMVTTAIAPGGAGIGQNYGFPWTTGTILVRGTGASPLGQPQGGTFSIQGFDDRTAMGAGNIQLVAGHLSQASIQGPNGTPNYSVLRLELPEPRGAQGLAAGVVALLALAAWRGRCRRG